MKDPFELKANSIPALNELFPDEESCIRHLEAINWQDRKSTRLNSSHASKSRMPSSA